MKTKKCEKVLILLLKSCQFKTICKEWGATEIKGLIKKEKEYEKYIMGRNNTRKHTILVFHLWINLDNNKLLTGCVKLFAKSGDQGIK